MGPPEWIIMVYKRGAEVLTVSIITSWLWQAPAVKALFGTQGRAFTMNLKAACGLRCAPDWNSHWQVRCEAKGNSLRPNVAPQAPWRGAQARRHLWRQQVWCSTSYSWPGSCTAGWSSRPCQEPICLHLLKTSQRLKLLANYGRLFIFWWQSLESLWERVPLLSVDWGLRLALAKLQQLLPTRQERFN